MKNNTNNVVLTKEQLADLLAEARAEGAASVVVKAKAHKVTADEVTLKAREVTGMKKLNVPKDIAHKIVGFNGTFNEGLGRELGRYSNKNEKVGDDRASQDRYWVAKAIDTSGFYQHPEFGIVYASISIQKAGMRKLWSIDRMAKVELKNYLATVPMDERTV